MTWTKRGWTRSAGGAIAAVAAVLASAASRTVVAQGAQPPIVSIRETAASLVRAGIATDNARTILAAAQLLITAERASPGLQRVGPVAADTGRPDEQTKSGVFTAAGLLRLALRVAVEQQDVTTARVAATSPRTRRSGSATRRSRKSSAPRRRRSPSRAAPRAAQSGRMASSPPTRLPSTRSAFRAATRLTRSMSRPAMHWPTSIVTCTRGSGSWPGTTGSAATAASSGARS